MLDRLALTARLLPGLPKLDGAQAEGPRHRRGSHRGAGAAPRRCSPSSSTASASRATASSTRDANRVAHWARAQRAARAATSSRCAWRTARSTSPTWAGLAKLGVDDRADQHEPRRQRAGATRSRPRARASSCSARSASSASPAPRTRCRHRSRSGSRATRSGARGVAGRRARLSRPRSRAVRTAIRTRALREGLVAGDDLFYIYTSGTTGLPKAARFSHMRFLGMGDLAAFALSLRPARRPLLRAAALPLGRRRDAGRRRCSRAAPPWRCAAASARAASGTTSAATTRPASSTSASSAATC